MRARQHPSKRTIVPKTRIILGYRSVEIKTFVGGKWVFHKKCKINLKQKCLHFKRHFFCFESVYFYQERYFTYFVVF